MADHNPNIFQGRWVASPEWLNFPDTIRARSPFDKTKSCQMQLGRRDLIRAAEAHRRQIAYALWSTLLGKAPPVPHHLVDANSGLTRLEDAHACFMGVKRPVSDDDSGDRMVAYVLKPTFQFVFEFLPPIVFARKMPVPPDLVFVAFAHLDKIEDRGSTMGVLTHWQLIDADSTGMLPVGHSARYNMRLW